MADSYYQGKIVDLIGVPDGVEREFVTPSAFAPDTIKVFWNGVEYRADDDLKGWVEVSTSRIRFNVAPLANDILQAYYHETNPVPGLDNVVGTPFDPDGVLP